MTTSPMFSPSQRGHKFPKTAMRRHSIVMIMDHTTHCTYVNPHCTSLECYSRLTYTYFSQMKLSTACARRGAADLRLGRDLRTLFSSFQPSPHSFVYSHTELVMRARALLPPSLPDPPTTSLPPLPDGPTPQSSPHQFYLYIYLFYPGFAGYRF